MIENIYAGPQGSFVPKTFSRVQPACRRMAELGFIVVQIDGMGTTNRSKAFHDVAWKNLGDAGFPDRILWHKAVAAKYPYYDITRVGIYGSSAGGQNATGRAALPSASSTRSAVADCGCHDNRMDKIWWNEQWMGWPLGPHYAASVERRQRARSCRASCCSSSASWTRNVDPVVDDAGRERADQAQQGLRPARRARQPATASGGAYGERKRYDFFVRHLLGVEPPEWKAIEDAMKKNGATDRVKLTEIALTVAQSSLLDRRPTGLQTQPAPEPARRRNRTRTIPSSPCRSPPSA